MDKNQLTRIQNDRYAKAEGSGAERTLELAIKDCRKTIEEGASRYRSLNGEEKKSEIKNIIVEYVMREKPRVDEFMRDGRLDSVRLIDKLVEEITDYGILSKAMIDPRVNEIQCNGREIKIEIEGRVVDYLDDSGNIIRFTSVDQQDIVLKKLMQDVRLTPKDALMNAQTVEGYRIAAVHQTALGNDPTDPTNDVYHSFVLRKFKEIKLTLSEIVLFHTLTDNMARMLRLLTDGGLTFFTVGATSSGKTTLNNAINKDIPTTTRTVLIQNPSEIDLRQKSPTGRVINNVLHLEAKSIENPSEHDPTVPNLMNQILRLSPTFAGVGEIRANIEFKLCMKILLAGHPVNSTYHSEDAESAISRFLNAYLAESGNESPEQALQVLTSLVDIIIVQKKMRDGSRKVIQIAEICGVDPEDNLKPLINDIYIFDTQGFEPKLDANGDVLEIRGVHRRVGSISPALINKLRLEGVPQSKYDFLIGSPDKNFKETYSGNLDKPTERK